jgi:predicted porin
MKMNKKIIALAITSVFAAPVAMADTSNVNVYGQFSVSADYVTGTSVVNSTTAGGLVESRYRISSNNSLIGFKGTEDLGDGLSAIWQYESLIALDRQNIDNVNAQSAEFTTLGRTGAQSRRNTFAGLTDKSYGTLTLGLQDTPLKIAIQPANVFPRSYPSDYRAVFAVPGAFSNVRAENSILYATPSLGGVVIKALYGARNEGGNGNLAEPVINSYSVGYSDSSFSGILAYEYTRSISDPIGAVTSKESTVRTLRAVAGYTFGDVKLGAAVEKNNNVTIGSPTLLAPAGGAIAAVNAMAYYLSASYKVGLNTFKLAHAKRLNNKANDTVAASGFINNTDDGAVHNTIAVERALSKRTLVYALYSTVTNGLNGTFGIGGGNTGIAPVGALRLGTARDFSLGMITTF